MRSLSLSFTSIRHPQASAAFIHHERPKIWPSQLTRHFSVRDEKNHNDELGNEPDLFDYFDPLLSPHQYPKGIDAKKNSKNKDSQYAKELISFSSMNENSKSNESTQSDSFLFDPTLSPHIYPNGVDAGPQQRGQDFEDFTIAALGNSNQGMIGILLIDHGSRRASSNEQLQLIAKRYQKQLPNNYVVYAAHMEIASPTISDGIEYLSQIPNMSTILCHPYFLSPGRHVSEDVPTLIREAVQRLDNVNFINEQSTSLFQNSLSVVNDTKIQLYMTDAVGSDLDCMINVIDQMVQQTLIRVIPQPFN